jgi:hypothetical protein
MALDLRTLMIRRDFSDDSFLISLGIRVNVSERFDNIYIEVNNICTEVQLSFLHITKVVAVNTTSVLCDTRL